MDTEIYRKFDKFCLLLQSYLCIAAVFVLTFGAAVLLSSPSAEAQTVYYLQNDQSPMGTSQTWKTAADWSGGIAPGSTNGVIFTVGDGYMLRAPGNANTSTPENFPYKNGGDYNWLYLGYNHDATAYNTGYLNIKCPTVVINKLVLGNGTVYNGNDNLALTIQGTILVNGNGTLKSNNTSASDTRSMTVESSISGAGTLNFNTGEKTNDDTKIGFYLNPVDSSGFTGNVIIDGNSKVSFEKANVFANASSITSAGDLTLNTNQMFKNLSGSGGSIVNNAALTLNQTSNATYGGSITGTGSLTKTGSGDLTISGTLNYSGDTTISSGTLIPTGPVRLYNLTGAGNLVCNSSEILRLINNTDTTFDGVISGTSSMDKMGSGALTLSQAPSIGPTKISEGELILGAGGTLQDLSGSGALTNNGSQALTINYASSSSNQSYSGNITNNSSRPLTINYYSNQTNSGNIVSSQGLTIYVDSGKTATHSKTISSTNGALVKTGNGTLKLTSTENQSINCDVVINGGTILLDNKVSDKNRFGAGRTVTINSGGTLECNSTDSLGNKDAELTININGGTLELNSIDPLNPSNQTFMNKTVVLTGGTIQDKEGVSSDGIHVKVGSSFTAKASDDPLATYPTVSTISVPIKIRHVENPDQTTVQNPDPLNITVEENAQLIFADYIWNDNPKAMGIDKNGDGILTFDYTKDSSRKYTRPITVSKGVLELKNGALAKDGTIEVKSTGDLELFVDGDVPQSMTVKTANKIFGPGDIKKTGDGALTLCTEAQGLVSAESLVVSSGQLDFQGYMGGKVSVDSGAVFSPGDSIGEATFGGGFILNEAGAELLMEIGGADISLNDSVIASGDLTFHDGSIVYLAATDDCTLQEGDEFTAVLHGVNSPDIASDFISKYVRSSDFNNLQYVQLTSGAYSGKYAITGRRYIDHNAVPEPSTWALLILGVAGLIILRKHSSRF